jgi:hypothetical protein
MRVVIISAAALILLGIVIFSVHSGSNSGTIPNDKGIIQKIDYNNSYFDVQEDWDGFETIVVDIDKFRRAADSGIVTLRLMGANFEVKIKEKSRSEGETFYTGSIIGKNQSRADFYVQEDFLYGSVEPGEPWNVTYNIAHTDVRYNGKIVHVIFMTDWEKQQERLKKNGVDPLQFSLKNGDSKKHMISIEIFDFNNKSVYKETYTMKPGDEISSPKIDTQLGQYRYEIILDNKFTFEEKIQASYAANLGGSEKLNLTIRDDPDNSIEFAREIA